MLDDLQQLIRKVQAITEAREQAKGAKKVLLKRLRQEFGALNLKDGKKLLEEFQKRERSKAESYAKKKKAFLKKWKDVL